MAQTLKSLLTKTVQDSINLMVLDIEAMSHEQLSLKLNDQSRTAYDFCYEVSVVNDRIGKRAAGIDPGKWPFETWATAPTDLQTKENIAASVKNSGAELIAAIENSADEDLLKELDLPSGKTSIAELALHAGFHTGYHDGQLNLIQQTSGDMEVHWPMG